MSFVYLGHMVGLLKDVITCNFIGSGDSFLLIHNQKFNLGDPRHGV